MTPYDQFVLVILLWIMAPLLMAGALTTPVILVTMLKRVRCALQRHVNKGSYTNCP